MSLIIKDMAMPINNEAIVITADGKASKIYGGTIAVMGGYVTENSTAVELPPHGDLIDRDVAYDMIAEVDHAGNYVDMDAVGRGLYDTPTIIEAEMRGE